jgi:hypothetical protein
MEIESGYEPGQGQERLMWYRNEQLARIRMEDLRAEARRLKFGRRDSWAEAGTHRATRRTVRHLIARLGFAAGHAAFAIARAFDSTAGPSDIPAAIAGTQRPSGNC